jgi:hypothetical protein
MAELDSGIALFQIAGRDETVSFKKVSSADIRLNSNV